MRRFIPLALLLFFCFSTFAQRNGYSRVRIHRVKVTAGIYTNKDIHASIAYPRDADVPWSKYSNGTYFFDVTFYKMSNFELSLGLGYQKANIRPENNPNDLRVGYYTLMPQFRKYWYTTPDDFVEVYSGVGLGFTMVSEVYSGGSTRDATYVIPGIHLNVIGVRFGGNFGGFVEMGYGTKGFMSGGVSLRL